MWSRGRFVLCILEFNREIRKVFIWVVLFGIFNECFFIMVVLNMKIRKNKENVCIIIYVKLVFIF